MKRKQFWLRAALHVVALLALVWVWSASLGYPLVQEGQADRVLEAGKWAVRFLLFSLAMSPLNTYLGWRSAIALRKPAGLWAFGFASLHFAVSYLISSPRGTFLELPLAQFISFGVIALLILGIMALTSNRWAQKRLGKNWKRLHRLVYAASSAVLLHAWLALETKRAFADPLLINELRLYIGILAVLLILRLPFVRQILRGGTLTLVRRPREA
ncbi:MAG: ferric reductase-like transmembrane domain-containing protein [Anaerolineae bacterium]|nr:ferric reductase-like transmembrane domain-containing protein [Anaerolineae bacterium]